MKALGDVLTLTRKARGLTQEELGEKVGLTQVAITRYESGDRVPDQATITALAHALCVTPQLLHHGDRFEGALGLDAHMRRQKTTKTSVWRQLEARLNLLRVSTSFLLEKLTIHAERRIPTFDPDFEGPLLAARLVRAQWRMPMGPVVNLVRWLESAGCLIFEEDFGTPRVDGLSQWVGDHPLMLINSRATPDRKRRTIAHELGHLVLHSNDVSAELEKQADEFADEFMMPEAVIRPELRKINLPQLLELKREWGVSMQSIYERAFHFKMVTPAARTAFYRSMSARGWRTNEPSVQLIAEVPKLARQIGTALAAQGFDDGEVAEAAGFTILGESPFQPEESTRLRVV